MTENDDRPSPPPPYDVVAILLPGSIILDFDYDLFTLFTPPEPFMATSWSRNDNDDSVNGIVFINLQHAQADTLIDSWWSRVQEKDSLSPLVVPHKKKRNDDHVATTLWGGASWRLLRPVIESLLVVEMPRPDHRVTNVTKNQHYPPEEDAMMKQLVRNLPQERDGFIIELSYPLPTTTTTNDTDHPPTNPPHYPYCLKGFSVPSTLSMFHTATPPGTLLAVHNDDDDDMDHNETATFMAVLVTIQTMADAVCYRFYPKCEIL